MGSLIGGIIPAVLLGFFAVLQKSANQNGIGIGIYLVLSGVTITLLGLAVYLTVPDRAVSGASALFTCLSSLLWAASMVLIQLAISHYNIEISKLVPLFNMNTLIAVILGLWLFSEWTHLNLLSLGTGACLIVVGGILVSLS